MSPDYYCFDQFLHEAGSPPDCLLRQFPGDNDIDIDEDDIAASVAVDGGEQDWDLQPDHQGAALFEAASVNVPPPLLPLDPAAPLADLNGSQLPPNLTMTDDWSGWSGAQRCQHRGCTSKTVFKEASKLKEHMVNIHLQPLVCDFPGCTHRKPFGRRDDLKRHQKTKHRGLEDRPFKCPDTQCPSHSIGFARKDKFWDHTRSSHGLLQCRKPHCGEFFNGGRDHHLREKHGQYACFLGSCPGHSYRGAFGEFSEMGLVSHLEEAHGCTLADAKESVRRMLDGKTPFAIFHLDMEGLTWNNDCAVCRPKSE